MRNRRGERTSWDWNDDTDKWGALRLNDYIDWVKDTYGVDEAKKLFTHADSYRAVMDVKQSVKEEPIERQPTQILTSASMVKMAQEILNNSLREAVEDANNKLGL